MMTEITRMPPSNVESEHRLLDLAVKSANGKLEGDNQTVLADIVLDVLKEKDFYSEESRKRRRELEAHRLFMFDNTPKQLIEMLKNDEYLGLVLDVQDTSCKRWLIGELTEIISSCYGEDIGSEDIVGSIMNLVIELEIYRRQEEI